MVLIKRWTAASAALSTRSISNFCFVDATEGWIKFKNSTDSNAGAIRLCTSQVEL